MSNKLSHTAVEKYLECSLCYKLHYLDGIRPVRQKSALLFGSALDSGLNHLLLTKDLAEATNIFHKQWSKVNDEMTDFSKSDLDQELIEYFSVEWSNLHSASWLSLFYKGNLFLEQYYKDILPRIKKVIAVQERMSLKNADGDEITGILDLIVKWEDGKTYLLDNKSSSVKYAPDSAKMGQQLPLSYYIVKDKYKLDGVGYIVMSKKINKNKVKKCKKCGMICETNHKTCNENIPDLTEKGPIYNRCNGEFDVTINPSVDIDIILNQVDESDEKRVIETFDDVNNKIINKEFATEHRKELNKYYQRCSYYNYYEGNPEFIKLPKKEKKNEKDL